MDEKEGEMERCKIWREKGARNSRESSSFCPDEFKSVRVVNHQSPYSLLRRSPWRHFASLRD